MNILFLHHSTGQAVWEGGVPEWFAAYNLEHGTSYRIVERTFPKKRPYGWRNYPYDYWNIWVNHAGPDPYAEEPTLEILTQQYDVIVFKHCFPVSDVLPDTGSPAVDSQDKRLEHYKVQYEALRQKLLSFPHTAFIVWTGSALTQGSTSEENGRRAREFFSWVKHVWRQPDDNIFIWDFFELQTEGGLYFKDGYAADPYDSHPSHEFSERVAPDLCRAIVDVAKQWHGRRLPSMLTLGAEG